MTETAHARRPDAARAHAEGYTLTVEDAAALIGKSADTIRRYVRAGKLPAQRTAGTHTLEYRLRPEDVEDAHARTHASSPMTEPTSTCLHTLRGHQASWPQFCCTR